MMNNNDFDDFLFFPELDKNKKVYALPDEYFNTFLDTIITRIKLSSIEMPNNFAIPQNYFSDFPALILNKIKNAEAEFRTSVLDSISKANVYSVPENYFANLSENISAKCNPHEEIKEIKIIPLKAKRHSWQMGVAAAVISAIVLAAGFLWENHSDDINHKTNFAQNTSSGVENIENDLSKLSDDEIAAYLSTPDGSDESSLQQEDTNANRTQQQLKSVSNEEVENYLANMPSQY